MRVFDAFGQCFCLLLIGNKEYLGCQVKPGVVRRKNGKVKGKEIEKQGVDQAIGSPRPDVNTYLARYICIH